MQENQLYDIYTIVHVPLWQTRSCYIFIGLIGCLVLVMVACALIKWWRKKQRYKPSWVRALDSLNELSSRYDAHQGKQFYIDITAILKKYLHERFGFNVLSKTDQEMLAYLATTDFPQELLLHLTTIVDDSVMVKFANHHVIQEQMQKDMHLGKAIVRATVPRNGK